MKSDPSNPNLAPEYSKYHVLESAPLLSIESQHEITAAKNELMCLQPSPSRNNCKS